MKYLIYLLSWFYLKMTTFLDEYWKINLNALSLRHIGDRDFKNINRLVIVELFIYIVRSVMFCMHLALEKRTIQQ